MIKLNTKLIRFLEYAAVVLSGCIFVLVSATWTSPLFPEMYGYDSAWYSLMGRAITKGYVPYRDYFDLKGPVFFFIEAIGQFICRGRVGIYIIECAAAGVSSFFIYKTAALFLKRIQAFAVLILYYFVYVSIFWGGNTCEEYMMAFNFSCIYLMFRFVKDINDGNENPDCSGSAFFFGLSFSIIALSKVTVAAPVLSAVLTVIYVLVVNKRTKLILKIIPAFAGGFFSVFIPVCMYFLFHGAFGDFIYCAFEFAFKRSTDYYEKFSLAWEKNLLICYFGLITGLVLKFRDKKNAYRRFFLICLSVITYLALHLGTPYLYYFITELAVFVIMTVEGFSLLNEVLAKTSDEHEKTNVFRLLGFEALVLLTVYMYAVPTFDKLSENFTYLKYPADVYYEGCIDTWEFIPFYERDRIYNLESGMIVYEINGDLPNNKYSVNLPYFLHLDPVIKQNVLSYLDVKKPKWIISEKMEDFDDEDIKEYVFSHYELARKTSAEEIYRRLE